MSTITLAEAVRRTGVSANTIRRRLKAGAITGAEQRGNGAWKIPTAGLVAAGFTLDTHDDQPSLQPVVSSAPSSDVVGLVDDVERVRLELELAQALTDRAAVAEDVERFKRANQQLESDLEQERAERHRLEVSNAATVAERDSLRERHAETQERLTATDRRLSEELAALRTDSETQRDELRGQLAAQRDAMQAELDAARANMTWRSRRRLKKSNPSP